IEDPRMIGTVEESAHFYEAFAAPLTDDGDERQMQNAKCKVQNAKSVPATQHPTPNTEHPIARFCTENTLYIALLAARIWKEEPQRFDELFAIQARTSREREWGYKFPSDELRAEALDAVQKHFEAAGASSMSRMPNGYELDATMMRRGIPFDIDSKTRIPGDWLQVCQRISQSENGLARWEVRSAAPQTS